MRRTIPGSGSKILRSKPFAYAIVTCISEILRIMRNLALALTLTAASMAAADSIEAVRGRAQLTTATAQKASVQIEARKVVKGEKTRTGGEMKLTMKGGILIARKLTSVSVVDKTGAVSGPAVFHTKIDGKPVRMAGKVTVTVIDSSQPKDPSGTPDSIKAVFTPTTGSAMTFTGVVAKGDLAALKRTP